MLNFYILHLASQAGEGKLIAQNECSLWFMGLISIATQASSW